MTHWAPVEQNFQLMSDFEVALSVINPDEPPRVDVHDEWRQFALWLSGRYGLLNVDGHEIGLSPKLVNDLLAWGDAADALFDQDYPPDSLLPEGHYETGYELAKRVRAELPAEWIVTTNDPTTRAKVVLPLRELPPGLTNNLS